MFKYVSDSLQEALLFMITLLIDMLLFNRKLESKHVSFKEKIIQFHYRP